MLSKYLLTTTAAATVTVALLAGACTRGSGGATGGNGGSGSGGGGSAVDLGVGAPDLADVTSADLAAADLLYDSDGPEPYQQVQLTATGSGKSIPLVLFVPTTAGPRPVVILSSGLQQPAAAYAPYARRLASWGILAVTRDDPGILAQSQSLADDLAFVVGWLPTMFSVDPARVGLAGHSRGGMASLLALEAAAFPARGFFGLDPVDNAGAAAAKLGTLAVPSVFLGEVTDSGAAGGGGMACAPADQNYDILFKAAPAPALELTAVGADHTQFEDPASCSFCTLCTAGSADGAEVLRESVRALTAFFARELLGDTRENATLDASLAGDVAAGRLTLQKK